MKKGKIVTVYTVTILCRNIPSPHFSAKISLNYEILSNVFFQCVLNSFGLFRISGFSFPKHSEGQLLFFSLTQ